MSNFSLTPEPANSSTVEQLTINAKQISGTLKVLSGKQGDYLVSVIPSLNVSGYGIDENDAFESLQENLKIFCKDLFSLSENKRNIELKKLGWIQNKTFKRKFSNAFIDENGILQNFDNPSEVKHQVLAEYNIGK